MVFPCKLPQPKGQNGNRFEQPIFKRRVCISKLRLWFVHTSISGSSMPARECWPIQPYKLLPRQDSRITEPSQRKHNDSHTSLYIRDTNVLINCSSVSTHPYLKTWRTNSFKTLEMFEFIFPLYIYLISSGRHHYTIHRSLFYSGLFLKNHILSECVPAWFQVSTIVESCCGSFICLAIIKSFLNYRSRPQPLFSAHTLLTG